METHGKCNDYPIGVQPNGWKRTNNLKNFERGNSVVRNYKRVEFSEIKCKYSQCNKIFLPKSKINIYCSLKCSRSDKKYKHICTNCGKSFETNKRSVYCCSDECRKIRKGIAAKRSYVGYECQVCGFDTGNRHRKFCSEKCREKWKIQQFKGSDPYGFYKSRVLSFGRRVRYHRFVMEQHLGRKLETWEHVNHIDMNKFNNDISNLEILTSSEHAIHHLKNHERDENGRFIH